MNYDFKQGDSVAIVHSHWNRSIERIATVSRVTATLALVDMMKFNRATGREHGNRYGSYSIEPATSEVLSEMATQRRKAARRDFLRRFLDGNWQSIGDENLDKIAAALGFEQGPQGKVRNNLTVNLITIMLRPKYTHDEETGRV